MEKTAVEWLIEEYFGGMENCTFYFRYHIDQAKAMEKQQIVDAWNDGLWGKLREGEDNAESYYKETYKKK